MLRSHIARLASVTPATARSTVRSYATPPPPRPDEPTPHSKPTQGGSNTLLYSVLGVAVAAGAYYYYTNPEDVNAAKEKAHKDQQEMEKKARETVQAGKARADDAYKQGQAKYDIAKAEGRDKLHEIEDKARQSVADGQAKADAYKQSAQRSISDVRDSTENLYKEARSTAGRQLADARSDAEDKAKSSWFGWLGWGKAKADEIKEDAANKVVKSADDVRNRAEKHT